MKDLQQEISIPKHLYNSYESLSMSKIWSQAYRPNTLEDYICQDPAQRKQFQKYVAEQEFPHLLLSGVQGSGKTTLSLILTKAMELDEADILKINCSDEMIEAIRDKVKSFVGMYSFGKYKIVRLEEFDYMSQGGQGALRAIMDDASNNVRFIATCNYANKIMPAIKSRFTHFHFKTPNRESILMRVGEILALEDIDFDMDTLQKFVEIGYPDIRKTIGLCQDNSSTGKLELPTQDVSNADYRFDMLELMEKKNFRDLRKLVCENVSREEFEGLYTFLYQNIHRVYEDTTTQEQAIVKIAEYLYKNGLCADQELNFAALTIELAML